MLARRTHHTGFTVSDVERSVAFYRDVLGMEVVAQWVGTADYLAVHTGYPGVRLNIAFVKVPGSDQMIELLEYASHPGEPTDRARNRPGNGHLCFVVDDTWASYRELVAKGVRFDNEPVTITTGFNVGAVVVYFLDPDGFTLELYQPAPGR